jgi:hypothetical protein
MDLLSAGDGGSRSWQSLLWHQWVAALRAEAAVLAHDPRRSPPPRRSKSARRSQVGPRPASGNRTRGRPAGCAPSGRGRTPRDRCPDLPASAARRTWRIGSRPYWPPGWRRCSRPEVPTAMLHLCVPTENRARSVVGAATIIPSTDSGVRAATQSCCPCNSTSPGAYEGKRLCQRSAPAEQRIRSLSTGSTGPGRRS